MNTDDEQYDTLQVLVQAGLVPASALERDAHHDYPVAPCHSGPDSLLSSLVPSGAEQSPTGTQPTDTRDTDTSRASTPGTLAGSTDSTSGKDDAIATIARAVWPEESEVA